MSQVKDLLQRVELIEHENKELHAKVVDLKHLVLEMKQNEHIHVQNPLLPSHTLQIELFHIKNLLN